MNWHGTDICDVRAHFKRPARQARLTAVKYSERDSQDLRRAPAVEEIRVHRAVLKSVLIRKK
jgi:hypothetical protein